MSKIRDTFTIHYVNKVHKGKKLKSKIYPSYSIRRKLGYKEAHKTCLQYFNQQSKVLHKLLLHCKLPFMNVQTQIDKIHVYEGSLKLTLMTKFINKSKSSSTSFSLGEDIRTDHTCILTSKICLCNHLYCHCSA